MSRVVQIVASGVEITFTPEGDRFTQRIALDARPCLLAMDEVPGFSESWPPSPPLQEVHLEQRPDAQLALMIGRAGTSHWSISCELDAARGELRFDVACRIKQPAAWLGSMYQLAAGVTYLGDQAAGELRSGHRAFFQVKAECDCQIVWQPENQRLAFVPEPADPTAVLGENRTVPRTLRWRYRFQSAFLRP